MLVRYQCHLISAELFPEDAYSLSFNTMTSKDNVSFVNHLDGIALISSTGDTTAAPSDSTTLVHTFKVAHSPDDSLKNSLKRDASLFTTFNEGKHWDTWFMNALSTAREQYAAKVLNPDHLPLTNDDVILFKEKQKFMCDVFDNTL